jgi:replicative DNA helicase
MIRFEDDRRTRAEQRVLSSLLKSPAMIRHCPHLRPHDFSHELHGAAYRAIVQLIARKEPVSALTVSYEITAMFNLVHPAYRHRVTRARAPVQGYLIGLEDLSAVPSNVGYYVAVMLDPACNESSARHVVMR